jgi:membrane protein involved in colicin uptake
MKNALEFSVIIFVLLFSVLVLTSLPTMAETSANIKKILVNK